MCNHFLLVTTFFKGSLLQNAKFLPVKSLLLLKPLLSYCDHFHHWNWTLKQQRAILGGVWFNVVLHSLKYRNLYLDGVALSVFTE